MRQGYKPSWFEVVIIGAYALPFYFIAAMFALGTAAWLASAVGLLPPLPTEKDITEMVGRDCARLYNLHNPRQNFEALRKDLTWEEADEACELNGFKYEERK